MTKSCNQCKNQFEITETDQVFYQKVQVPEPTFCPPCRQQRRLAFRNELYLYERKCDFSGKPTLSMYSPDKPYRIYDQTVWWSDEWDPMTYGRDFDFSKPFFQQFAELQKEVPRMSLNAMNNENSYFVNYSGRSKNAYLIFSSEECEDCYYGRYSLKNFKCADFDCTDDSSFCYDVLYMENCNTCLFSQKCTSSSNLYFCYDMRNCHNCIFSTNLRNKEYYVFNKPVSKDEFKKIRDELMLSSYKGIQEATKKSQVFFQTQPKKYLETMQCDDSLGDYLKNSKNAKYCFDSINLEDVKYASFLVDAKDCQDWDFYALGGELCYEMVSSAYQINSCKFSMNCWDTNVNVLYSDLCLGNQNLFGCVGLRHKKYCILNKQYDKEQYEKLTTQIIEHMKKTGEYGQFFPITLSPFAYNESVAQEYFPLTKEQTLAKGLKWKDEDPKAYKSQTYQIPDNIKDIPDSITQEILSCDQCAKNYKITAQELALYKNLQIAVPRKCFWCRHKNRMSLRNPRKFWNRKCDKCGTKIETTYSPEKPDPVYCESCYLSAVN